MVNIVSLVGLKYFTWNCIELFIKMEFWHTNTLLYLPHYIIDKIKITHNKIQDYELWILLRYNVYLVRLIEKSSEVVSTVSPISHRTSARGRALTSHSNLTLVPRDDVTCGRVTLTCDGVIITRGKRAAKPKHWLKYSNWYFFKY